MGRVRRWARVAWGVAALLLVESLVFGVSTLPAIGFWSWVSRQPVLGPEIVRTLVLAVSVAPAYLIFSCALMFSTALACRGLGWKASAGAFPVRELGPEVVAWGKHNAAAHVVRVICGELFRATPVWRWYLRGMGATIGRGVHVNTAAVYDINLFTVGDHVVVGGRAQLSAHLVEAGVLKLQGCTFDKGATIGTGSIVSPGVHVGENGQVGALSFVTKGTHVPANTAFGGVPARLIKAFDPVEAPGEEVLYRGPGESVEGRGPKGEG